MLISLCIFIFSIKGQVQISRSSDNLSILVWNHHPHHRPPPHTLPLGVGWKFLVWLFCKNKEVYHFLTILLSFIHLSGDRRYTPSVKWCIVCFAFVFFYQGFLSRTLMTPGKQGKGGTIFYSTLPLPSTHEHSDIYLQLCMWDYYHLFLITQLLFTRLLLDEIYHLIELPFDWLMNWCWFFFIFLLI